MFDQWSAASDLVADPAAITARWKGGQPIPQAAINARARIERSGCAIVRHQGDEIARIYKYRDDTAFWVRSAGLQLETTIVDVRVGSAPPVEREYVLGRGVVDGVVVSKNIDTEAWRQAIERRKVRHQKLLDHLARAANHAGLDYKETQYIDLIVGRRHLIEAKTLSADDSVQVRAAIGQLYHYRFIHRAMYPHVDLIAAFSRKPIDERADSLVEFMAECSITVIWWAQDRFEGAGQIPPWIEQYRDFKTRVRA